MRVVPLASSYHPLPVRAYPSLRTPPRHMLSFESTALGYSASIYGRTRRPYWAGRERLVDLRRGSSHGRGAGEGAKSKRTYGGGSGLTQGRSTGGDWPHARARIQSLRAKRERSASTHAMRKQFEKLCMRAMKWGARRQLPKF
eukprot:1427815-Pleurochrysis_carterae.AAC.3